MIALTMDWCSAWIGVPISVLLHMRVFAMGRISTLTQSFRVPILANVTGWFHIIVFMARAATIFLLKSQAGATHANRLSQILLVSLVGVLALK